MLQYRNTYVICISTCNIINAFTYLTYYYKGGLNLFFKNIKKSIGILSILAIFITGCSNSNIESNQVDNSNNSSTAIVEESNVDKNKDLSNENKNEENTETSNTTTAQSNSNNTEDIFAGYKLIEVDGGNLSGHREPNVVVDIGFGDREYWAFTNEYGRM